jgi:hypothetical protein
MDAGILEQVLSHIHNWFDHGQIGLSGCAISEGRLPASISIPEGAWYRIQGSLFNDGLHKHPADDLTDETFDGTITVCAIPRALLLVVEDIAAWQDANGKVVDGPYASESFGGYTYSIKSDSGSNSGSGGLSGWRLAFRDRLNPWRKIS